MKFCQSASSGQIVKSGFSFASLVRLSVSSLLILSLTACSDKIIKTQEQLSAEVELADLILIINRNLYVEPNARNTYFQGGYAQQLLSTDKYIPFCRFSIDYEQAGTADTTKIDAQRMAVVSINRARQTADLDQPRAARHAAVWQPVQVAGGSDLLIASEKQLDSWVTRLNLQSPSQPWISGLDCEVFGSRKGHLTIDDIRKVLNPSMALEEGRG